MRLPPEEITTERLRLHKHLLEESPTHFQAVDADRERLRQWLPWVDKTLKVEDTFRNIEMSFIDWNAGAIFDYTLKDQRNRFLGRVGMHTIDWSVPKAEIGYWLTSAAVGQGYLLEAIPALEKVFFGLGFERLEIRCDPNNTRSAKIPERLGYQLEGVLARNMRRAGTIRDTMVWAKLRRGR